MKKITKTRIALFLSTLAVIAGLAWLGGYNFDHRGVWVAYWSGFALAIAALVATHPLD